MTGKPGNRITRRTFLQNLSATLLTTAIPTVAAAVSETNGDKLVAAARAQIGITTSYDPAYCKMNFPNGDIARSTGICADVIIRACRDALGLDLQRLVHADMAAAFNAYPRVWGLTRPDTNIDHRRVLNLQVFWTRQNARRWTATGKPPGDAFGESMQAGDFVTWLIGGTLPHVGIVATAVPSGVTVVHNIGNGVEETPLAAFHNQRAVSRFRWPRI